MRVFYLTCLLLIHAHAHASVTVLRFDDGLIWTPQCSNDTVLEYHHSMRSSIQISALMKTVAVGTLGQATDHDVFVVIISAEPCIWNSNPVYATVSIESYEHCNAKLSPFNVAVTTPGGKIKCRCSPNHTGDQCQVTKPDVCCDGPCPFNNIAESQILSANRRQWCGGFNVDCIDNGSGVACQCPTPYTGDFCHDSPCGDCNEANHRSVHTPRGICSRNTHGEFACRCDETNPVFAAPETGCVIRDTNKTNLDRCGVIWKTSSEGGSWTAPCSDNGECVPGFGCRCRNDELYDSEHHCRKRRCLKCASNSTMECNENDGICRCDAQHAGRTCSVDRCWQTGGRRGPSGDCECRWLTHWEDNYGCVIDELRCSHSRAIIKPYRMRSALDGVDVLAVYLAQCNCKLLSSHHVIWRQITDPTHEYLGWCVSVCTNDRYWDPATRMCCHQFHINDCVHPIGI